MFPKATKTQEVLAWVIAILFFAILFGMAATS
jgi:hypothetical protein